MRSWLSFNRSILFFCSILSLLLLWLSVSFLMQAYTAKQDAQFLARSLETDTVIRATVTAVAEERAASHWLTGLDGLFSARYSLKRPHSRTDDAISAAFEEFERALANRRFSSQLTFQPAFIRQLIDDLHRRADDLSQRRQELIDDLNLPLDERNQRLQLSIFDYYGYLITQLEELRKAFRFRPVRLAPEVETGLMISNAAWNLNLSHHLLSALFEGYITSGKTALGSAYERSLNMQRSVDRHWDQIKNIDAYNSVDQQLHKQAIELNDWFGNTYFPEVRRMTRAIGELSPAPYTNWEWRKLAQSLETQTMHIFDRADYVSTQRIQAKLRTANRNLLIDVLLVISCAGLMLGALWVGQRIHYQANHDDLTQLSNRRMFTSECESRLEEATARRHNYVLVVINLDNFKAVNDSLGQLTGDQFLQAIAQRIASAAGRDAVVARMGGDEFSVLQRYQRDRSAFALVQHIADAVTDRIYLGNQSVNVTARVGYSLFPRDAGNLEGLRKAADLAIHHARLKGAGTIEAYNRTIASAFKERKILMADLTRAIENREFELHYQPQVGMQSGAVEGLEALLRWNHPERGAVSPHHFIEVAEDAGLLPQIGRWVIEEAARQTAQWRDRDHLRVRMSVNVSVHQFLHGDIAKIVRHALELHFLDASQFELEITESVAMAEMDRVQQKLQSLRQLGVRVALDDFGTGYSSLSYLQDLPLDTLKIDRSFITKLDDSNGNQLVLLESIAHIARSLNFHTVAEGVETDIQLHHVRALGINLVQGYYYSRPLPAADVPLVVGRINDENGANGEVGQAA
jgi:diguanylate cyclase (GGDEF)-like protein